MLLPVLSRHIDFFPVFAEVGAFLVMNRDLATAGDVVLSLMATPSLFTQSDERQYLQMIAQFAQGHLDDSTFAALEQLATPFDAVDDASVA